MTHPEPDTRMTPHPDRPPVWGRFTTRTAQLFHQWQASHPDQPLTIRMWTLDESRKTPPLPHAFHGVIQAVAASGVVLRVTGRSGPFPQFVSWTDLWTGTAEVLTPDFMAAGHTANADSHSPSRGV